MESNRFLFIRQNFLNNLFCILGKSTSNTKTFQAMTIVLSGVRPDYKVPIVKCFRVTKVCFFKFRTQTGNTQNHTSLQNLQAQKVIISANLTAFLPLFALSPTHIPLNKQVNFPNLQMIPIMNIFLLSQFVQEH